MRVGKLVPVDLAVPEVFVSNLEGLWLREARQQARRSLQVQFNRDVMHLCFWLCLLSYCIQSVAVGTAGPQIAFGEVFAC